MKDGPLTAEEFSEFISAGDYSAIDIFLQGGMAPPRPGAAAVDTGFLRLDFEAGVMHEQAIILLEQRIGEMLGISSDPQGRHEASSSSSDKRREPGAQVLGEPSDSDIE